MNDLIIRPWRKGDDPGIRALHDRTPTIPDFPVDRPQPWPQDLDDISTNFRVFFVAEVQGQIVGMAGVIGLTDDFSAAVPPPAEVLAYLPDSERVVRMMRMRVAPDHQRQGIGRRLVETVVAWAVTEGCTHVILETTPEQDRAIALYASCGFGEIGRSQYQRWTLVWMLRELRSTNAST